MISLRAFRDGKDGYDPKEADPVRAAYSFGAAWTRLKAMVHDVESVVHADQHSVVLKHLKGRDTTLKRTLAHLSLKGPVRTLMDGLDFESEMSLPKDQVPVQGLLAEMEAIEKHDGLPVFTVKSATGAPAISAELTTEDSLSWFKDEKFGGEFKRCDVTAKRP